MKKTIMILTFVFLASISFASAINDIDDGEAYYSRDSGESFTNIANQSIFNLTNQGSAEITGWFNEGGYFNSSETDYMTKARFTGTRSAFTVNVWVFADSFPDSICQIWLHSGAYRNVNLYTSTGDNLFFSIYSNDGSECHVNSGVTATSEWIMVTGKFNSTATTIYINGTQKVTCTTTAGDLIDFDGGSPSANEFIGISTISTQYWDGGIDELGFWGYQLTDAQIMGLYTATKNPYIVGPLIDLLFANETDTTTYKTIFDEGEEILGYVNWTLSNGTIIDNTTGTCNMTFVGGVLEDRSLNTNFTICNVGCDFDTFTDEFEFHSANLTDPVVEDTVRFDACHLSSPVRDIDVSVQCGSITNNFTVDKSEFPLCSTGTGTIIVNFTDCINNLTMNASAGNGALNIGQGHRIVNFEVDREYVAHLNTGTDIIYNTTFNMFQTSHTHEYYKQGSKQVFANCTNTNANFSASKSENITIVNVPPQIFIEQVTTSLGTTTVSDGVEVEFANGTWEWFIAVVDNDIDIINYSWYNSSGALLFSHVENGTPETINTSSAIFADFGGNPFNLTVFANDTFGNSTTLSLIFNVTDTLNPSCDFASRYFIDMGNFTFNVTCTDENFFSLNVTCPANNQSFNVTGLNVPEYVFNQTFFLNVTDTCSFRYCDGHTTTSLSDVWFDSLKDEKYELFRNFQKVSELWVEDGEVEFVQLHDRLKFNIMFYDTKKSYQTVYYNVSPQSTHLFSSKYLGWVADPVSETWFDLNNIVDAKVVTINKGGGLWEFRIYTSEREVEFQSVGELNCVSGSFSVVAAFEYSLEPGVCPSTIPGILTLWMVLGFALFLMTVGWVWKIREPGFFGSLLLITVSWTVVACHLWAGYTCLGIGMYFLFWFILKK